MNTRAKVVQALTARGLPRDEAEFHMQTIDPVTAADLIRTVDTPADNMELYTLRLSVLGL